MEQIKKHIKKVVFINGLVWAVVYLVYAFINWTLINPFQWIIDLPKYSTELRGSILFSYITYSIVLYLILTSNDVEK